MDEKAASNLAIAHDTIMFMGEYLSEPRPASLTEAVDRIKNSRHLKLEHCILLNDEFYPISNVPPWDDEKKAQELRDCLVTQFKGVVEKRASNQRTTNPCGLPYADALHWTIVENRNGTKVLVSAKDQNSLTGYQLLAIELTLSCVNADLSLVNSMLSATSHLARKAIGQVIRSYQPHPIQSLQTTVFLNLARIHDRRRQCGDQDDARTLTKDTCETGVDSWNRQLDTLADCALAATFADLALLRIKNERESLSRSEDGKVKTQPCLAALESALAEHCKNRKSSAVETIRIAKEALEEKKLLRITLNLNEQVSCCQKSIPRTKQFTYCTTVEGSSKETLINPLESEIYVKSLCLTAAWRALLQGIREYSPVASIEEIADTTDLVRLLGETQKICRVYLQSSGATLERVLDEEKKSDKTPMPMAMNCQRIDSNFLYVYLFSRILASKRIRAFYKIAESGESDEWHKGSDRRLSQLLRWAVSPGEVTEYLQALAVVALRVLHLVDQREQPHFEHEFVDASPLEQTQAILKLVDRFAVLECGLDERFSVADQLGRAYAVDVVLYFSKPWYREHVYHVLDVLSLGLLLLDAPLMGPEDRWLKESLLDWVRERFQSDLEDADTRERVLQNWVLAALFHDVGYCLETIEAVSTLLSRLRSGPVEKYRQVLNAALDDAAEQFHQALNAWHLPQGRSELSRADYRLPDFSGSGFDGLNHGVTSFCHLLDALAEVDQLSGTLRAPNHPPNTRLVDGFVPALRAIYHHHLVDRPVDLETDPLSFLLILVDELQDWGRPRISRDEMAQGLAASWKYALRSPEPNASLVEAMLARLNPVAEDPSQADERVSPSPRFEIGPGGPVFHLVFQRPDNAEYQVVGTVLAKAANFQRLCLDNPPWGPDPLHTKGQRQRKLLIVSCIFPVPDDLYCGLRELDVLRDVSLRRPGLPYPEQLPKELRRTLFEQQPKEDVPIFGYDILKKARFGATSDRRHPGSLGPVRLDHEIFLFEVVQLGRLAIRETDGPHPLFPIEPGPWFVEIDRSREKLLNQHRLARRSTTS